MVSNPLGNPWSVSFSSFDALCEEVSSTDNRGRVALALPVLRLPPTKHL